MANNLNVNGSQAEYDTAQGFTTESSLEMTIMKTEVKEELYDFEENDIEYVNVKDEYIHSPEIIFEGENSGPTKSTEHISNENFGVGSCEISETYLESNKYRCQLCHCDFEEETYLRSHYEQCFLLADKKISAGGTYDCMLCTFSTPDRELFLKHIGMYKDGTSNGNLTKGILVKQKVKVKRYKCAECNYKTHNKSNFERHIRIHTKEKPFNCTYKNCKCTPEEKGSCKCSTCSFSTSSNSSLIKHVLVKHSGDPKKYKCSDCNYDTHSKANLARHIRIMHTDDRPFKCTYKNCKCTPGQEESCECEACGYATSTNNCLKSHILNKHSTDPKPYKCKDCDYETHTERNLMLHSRIHISSKPYKCKDCNYDTHIKRNLMLHSTIHTGEKPFKCTYKNCECTPGQKESCECRTCGHACPTQYRLKQHILAKHSAESKIFQCNDCDYGTYRKSSLVVHIRSHTGGKPFKCTYKDCKCIPGQEEPCGCTICEFATASNSSLKRHILRKHSAKSKKKIMRRN